MNLRKKTLLYSKKWKVFFLKNKITKERLSGQSSSFTSRYEADEKSNAELFFKENLTKSSTPIDRRTRSNIAATEVDAKLKKWWKSSYVKDKVFFNFYNNFIKGIYLKVVSATFVLVNFF